MFLGVKLMQFIAAVAAGRKAGHVAIKLRSLCAGETTVVLVNWSIGQTLGVN